MFCRDFVGQCRAWIQGFDEVNPMPKPRLIRFPGGQMGRSSYTPKARAVDVRKIAMDKIVRKRRRAGES